MNINTFVKELLQVGEQITIEAKNHDTTDNPEDKGYVQGLIKVNKMYLNKIDEFVKCENN